GGNVGIGTTSPGAKLHIKGTDELLRLVTTDDVTGGGGVYQTFDDINGSAAYMGFGGGTAQFDIANLKNGPITFVTNGTEKMRIQSGGNVGIGTSAPGNKLAVSGGVGIGTTAPGSLYLSTKAPDGGLIVEGKVGIGMTAPSTYTLDVGGGAAGNDIRGYDVYTHDGSATSFSDARLKTVQGSYARGLDEILALNPQYYHYKSTNSLGLASQETVVGVMAQDVQRLIPEAVKMTPSGYLSLTQGPIFYAMINAVKEQQNLITQNSERITQTNLKIDENISGVGDLQAAVNNKLSIVSNNLAVLDSRTTSDEADIVNLKTSLTAAETKLQADENNVAAFETSTNDTLSAMLETENMLTEKILSHEDRLKALEDKMATMTVSAGGAVAAIPANVITTDASGSAALAGIFKAKGVQADGVVAGSMAIKNDKNSDAPTMGDGEIISVKVDADSDGWDDETKVDGKSARVKTDAVSETAKIFVSFEGDPGSRYWVEKIKDADGKLTNSFSINVSDPVKKDTKFSWWIVEEK
ncbi:MAG: tail fiber domain-containing protein, partial [Candidatus Moranbacteria bacterium]|nr:tail fiber domain-containing protein [Candidatus Moranbacteria bacterium]